MKQFSLVAVLAAVLVLGSPMLAFGKEGGVKVIVSGVNVSLAAEFGGDTDGEFTKISGLKVTEAKDASGEVIEDLAGKILHYVPSERAEALVVGDGNLAKTVTITGTLWADSHTLAVDSFEASDDDDDWGDVPIGTQSSQQIL